MKFVTQLRMLREPRKERTMSLLVVSVATKPVTSEAMLFSNSVKVLVVAASTSGQFPWAQVICVLGELLLDAVGGGGVLAEELELGEEVGGYGW
jgi:hypothetical protein